MINHFGKVLTKSYIYEKMCFLLSNNSNIYATFLLYQGKLS